jgi:O-antigen ligase
MTENRVLVFSRLFHRLAEIALGLAIVFIPWRLRTNLFTQPIPPIYGDYTDGLVFLSDFFLVAALIFWSFDLLLLRRRVLLGPRLLAFALFGLTGMALVSAIFSINPLISIYHALRLVLFAGMYLYLVNEARSLRLFVWTAAGQVILQAWVAIAQSLQQRSLGLQALGELELDPAWFGVSIVGVQGARFLRAYGLSDHPNILGGCLAFGLVVIAVWVASRRSIWNGLLAAVFFAGLLALFLTYSRSAWLGFLAGILVAGALTWLVRNRSPFYREIWQRGFVLCLAAALLLAPFLWGNADLLGVRFNRSGSYQGAPEEQRSTNERSALNQAANQIFVDNAFLGVGIGTAPLALMQARPVFPYFYQPPHNTLLNAALETGITGAAFYFLLLIGPWLLLWGRRRSLAVTSELIALSGALAAISVVGFFDYYPWLLAPGRFWQWLLWGLWAASYQKSLLPQALTPPSSVLKTTLSNAVSSPSVAIPSVVPESDVSQSVAQVNHA